MAKNITLTQAEQIIKHQSCNDVTTIFIRCENCPTFYSNESECRAKLVNLANKIINLKTNIKTWKKL